jgi:hypothetical protein
MSDDKHYRIAKVLPSEYEAAYLPPEATPDGAANVIIPVMNVRIIAENGSIHEAKVAGFTPLETAEKLWDHKDGHKQFKQVQQ